MFKYCKVHQFDRSISVFWWTNCGNCVLHQYCSEKSSGKLYSEVLRTNTLPAGDELAAGRGADGLDVVILQLHSVSSQFVQHRCPDVRAVVADVVESLIVCHDEKDVRRLRNGRPVNKRLVWLIFHLVRAHHVPGQVPEAEQAHHGEAGQSWGCHGYLNPFISVKQINCNQTDSKS